MDAKELKKMLKRYDELYKEIRDVDNELWNEIYTEMVEEIERKYKEAKERAEKEYERRKKEEIQKMNDEYNLLQKELIEKIKEYNNDTKKEFMEKVRKYTEDGWKIEEVTVIDRYGVEQHRELGDVEITNFKPYSREIIRIEPTKKGFKYTIKWKEGYKDGKETSVYISIKDAQKIEVVLRKDEKGMGIVWSGSTITNIEEEPIRIFGV